MSRAQAEAYVAALLLLQDSDFALTVAAENDMRPRLLSTRCRIGLVVALSDHGAPAVWSTRLTILDRMKAGAKMELDAAGVALLRAATAMLALDEDAVSRIKHVARTIACAAHSEFIRTPHLAEAIQYRPPAYVVTVTTPAKEDD